MKNPCLIIKGERWKLEFGLGESKETHAGTQKLDSTKNPKAIDIKVTEGQGKDVKLFGIYELDGDNYKVCFSSGSSQKDRPRDFDAEPDTNRALFVFKRAKE